MNHALRGSAGPAVGHHAGRIGGLLALLSLPVHIVLSTVVSRQLAAVTLALIAGIYVGFAVQDGRARIITTEALVAAGFATSAFVGLWVTAWAIPTAFALHGIWDVAHHRHVTTRMPRWYVPFCAVYDWVFVAGLSAIWLLA